MQCSAVLTVCVASSTTSTVSPLRARPGFTSWDSFMVVVVVVMVVVMIMVVVMDMSWIWRWSAVQCS